MARGFIDELRISPGAEDHLAGHGISPDEVLDVLWDQPYFCRDKEADRKLMIGRTIGGRLLTVVIAQTSSDATIWDVVTGWLASKGERTAWTRQTRTRR